MYNPRNANQVYTALSPYWEIPYQRASTPLGSYLSTRELPRLKDHKTCGLGDQGPRSRCPLDQETEGAGDQRSRRARDQRRLKDHGSSRPEGTKEQRTKGPGDLRTRGPSQDYVV